MILFFLLSDLQALPFFNGAFLYFAAAYFFIQLYYQIERGVSMRTLVEVENSPQQQLSMEALKKVYPYDFILTRRLELAVEMNLLGSDGKCFWLTQKGIFFNRVFQFLKRFYQLDPFS